MSTHSNEAAHHVLPLRVYFGVWIALLVGTVITVWVGQFDFGSLNMVVAMAVATVKAALVALFFMHLLYDDKFNLVLFVATTLFVAIFFAFTWSDIYTRGWVDPVKQNFIKGDPAVDPYWKGGAAAPRPYLHPPDPSKAAEHGEHGEHAAPSH